MPTWLSIHHCVTSLRLLDFLTLEMCSTSDFTSVMSTVVQQNVVYILIQVVPKIAFSLSSFFRKKSEYISTAATTGFAFGINQQIRSRCILCIYRKP